MKEFTQKFKIYSIITLIIISIVGLFMLRSCQSGTVNAYIGRATRLKVPKDCHQVIGLTYGQDGRKMLTYRTKDGSIYMKEYSDRGIIEAKYILYGARFDEKGIRIEDKK